MDGESTIGTVRWMVERQARRRPDAPSLIHPDATAVSYADLLAVIEQVHARLAGMGIGPGDRVVLLLDPCLATATAKIAVAASATACPLNPAASLEELRHAVKRLGPKVVVTSADTMPVATDLGVAVMAIDVLLAPVESGKPSAEWPWPDLDDLTLIITTSGTTGRPRLVPLTHRQIHEGFPAYVSSMQYRDDDRVLNQGRPFHAASAGTIFATLLTGGAVVCPARTEPAYLVAVIKATHPTRTSAVPSVYTRLVDEVGASEIPPFRYLVSSGGAMPLALAERVSRAFGAPVVDMYGLAEAWYIAHAPLPIGSAPPGAMTLLPDCEVRLVDADGADVPQGTPGEIIVRGANVFSGYLGDEFDNANTFFPGGWLRTGDSGVIGDDGYFRFAGRIKDLLNRGGEKLSPVEIEAAFLTHPAVDEVAVFGIPHPQLGEDLVAAVVLRPGKTVEVRQLRRHLLGRLAPAKVPRTIRFVDALPRTGSEKVRRADLTNWFLAMEAASGR